jgi:hypothetical protein
MSSQFTLAAALACFLFGSGAPIGASGVVGGERRLSIVYVSVSGFGDVHIDAVLVDSEGRRTGTSRGQLLREIPGCWGGFGCEEGIPDEADTLAAASDAADTSCRVPIYHYFSVSNDAVTPVGLIDEQSCELRIVPATMGRVDIAFTLQPVGLSACKDTAMVWVRPGAEMRWKLSWGARDSVCDVRIQRLQPHSTTKRHGSR